MPDLDKCTAAIIKGLENVDTEKSGKWDANEFYQAIKPWISEKEKDVPDKIECTPKPKEVLKPKESVKDKGALGKKDPEIIMMKSQNIPTGIQKTKETPKPKAPPVEAKPTATVVKPEATVDKPELKMEEEKKADDKGLSGGAIAGIVIGGVVVLGAIAGGVFFALKKKDGA